jgi:hypothetical protein
MASPKSSSSHFGNLAETQFIPHKVGFSKTDIAMKVYKVLSVAVFLFSSIPLIGEADGLSYRVPASTIARRGHRRRRHKIPSTSNKVILVRGGGSPAKALSVAHLIQGSLFHFFAKQQAALFGWGNSNQSILLTETFGSYIIHMGIVSTLLLFERTENVSYAIGFSSAVAGTVTVLWLLISRHHVKAGITDSAMIISYGIPGAVAAFLGLEDHPWAPIYFKGISTIFGFSAIFTLIFPETAVAFWGMDATDQEVEAKRINLLARGYGNFLLASQVHNLLLLHGLAPEKALAYASLSGLIHFVDALLIQGDGRAKPLGYIFWLIYFAICISSILL